MWAKQFETFCSNLLIDSKEQGTIPLVMNGCQRWFVREVAEGLERGVRNFVVLKGRQEGISTICLALDLFWCFKYPGLQGGVITDNDSNKEKFRETIARYIDSLPRNMKAPMKVHNRNQTAFKNRSDLQYMVAGTRTGGNLGRAKALNYLHATECSSWADEEGLASLQSSLAEKSPNRLYIWESTARGFDLWYDICQTAKRAITQKFIFIGWWMKEEYSFQPKDREYEVYWGAAPHLTSKERDSVRKVKQFYDVDIHAGQIAWYRWHLAEKKNDDEMWMRQEYPWDEDEAFVVAGSQFFTSARLTHVYLQCRRERHDSYRYVTGSSFEYTALHRTNAQNADLKVWEEPKPEGVYCIGADPAYGSSEWADRFAIIVFRCYADRLVQVAEYCSADITTYQFAWIICHIAGAYKNSYLNLEMNGPGGAVQNEITNLQRSSANMTHGNGTLQDVLGGMRHYFWSRVDSPFTPATKTVGWKMNTDNKMALMNAFKDSFEIGRMEVKSLELISEMRNIVHDSQKDHIGASGRSKDDRVIAGALGHWLWASVLRTQLTARKLTFASVQNQEHHTSASLMHRNIQNYLKRSGIAQR